MPTAKREPAGALTPSTAAALAAKLANDECDRLHKKRPFTAEQYTAVLEGDMYRWGQLDPGAPSGPSAVVSFRADGTQPQTHQLDLTMPRITHRLYQNCVREFRIPGLYAD